MHIAFISYIALYFSTFLKQQDIIIDLPNLIDFFTIFNLNKIVTEINIYFTTLDS